MPSDPASAARSPAGPARDAQHAGLPFAVAAVTTARGMVGDALLAHGSTAHTIQTAHMVVGELVMNAIRHGEPTPDGTVDISWFVTDQHLRFSVHDGGQVDRLQARIPSPTALGGRGLGIIEMLCESWDYTTGDGTTVSAELALT